MWDDQPGIRMAEQIHGLVLISTCPNTLGGLRRELRFISLNAESHHWGNYDESPGKSKPRGAHAVILLPLGSLRNLHRGLELSDLPDGSSRAGRFPSVCDPSCGSSHEQQILTLRYSPQRKSSAAWKKKEEMKWQCLPCTGPSVKCFNYVISFDLHKNSTR